MVKVRLLRGSGLMQRTIDSMRTRGVKYCPAPFLPSLAAFSSSPSNAAPFTSTSIADQSSSSIMAMTRLRLTGLLKRGVACAKMSRQRVLREHEIAVKALVFVLSDN